MEFSGMDEKLFLSTVKSSGRNEILEIFWKSDGSAVWTNTEIPKDRYACVCGWVCIINERGKDHKKLKIYVPGWQCVISCFMNDDLPLPDSAEIMGSDTLAKGKCLWNLILTYNVNNLTQRKDIIKCSLLHCIVFWKMFSYESTLLDFFNCRHWSTKAFEYWMRYSIKGATGTWTYEYSRIVVVLLS